MCARADTRSPRSRSAQPFVLPGPDVVHPGFFGACSAHAVIGPKLARLLDDDPHGQIAVPETLARHRLGVQREGAQLGAGPLGAAVFLSLKLPPQAYVASEAVSAVLIHLTKSLAYGAQVSIGQTWNYLWTDQQAQLFPSVYTGNAAFNYNQPLWAGAGAEYTRIAGPAQAGLNGVTGVNQGVINAKIPADPRVLVIEAFTGNVPQGAVVRVTNLDGTDPVVAGTRLSQGGFEVELVAPTPGQWSP